MSHQLIAKFNKRIARSFTRSTRAGLVCCALIAFYPAMAQACHKPSGEDE
jgi:hypothetical protein